MRAETKKTLVVMSVYAIAMAFLEAAVVVYLRALYYPEGFELPLTRFLEPAMLSVEWMRELATLAMLLAVGVLAGRTMSERIVYTMYAFAMWDIFYYVFLKVILDWPASLLTLDVLFLIPWPWVGPVLTPMLVSVLMIIGSALILYFRERKRDVTLRIGEAVLIVVGAGVMLWSWLAYYGNVLFMGKEGVFPWGIFILGLVLAVLGTVLWGMRMQQRF